MLRKALGVVTILGDFLMTGAGVVITVCGVALSISDIHGAFPANEPAQTETETTVD